MKYLLKKTSPTEFLHETLWTKVPRIARDYKRVIHLTGLNVNSRSPQGCCCLRKLKWTSSLSGVSHRLFRCFVDAVYHECIECIECIKIERQIQNADQSWIRWNRFLRFTANVRNVASIPEDNLASMDSTNEIYMFHVSMVLKSCWINKETMTEILPIKTKTGKFQRGLWKWNLQFL